jgi:hypothetical protein|nr:MAG TPA: hypothetical protein [Bacteriophage sp.]
MILRFQVIEKEKGTKVIDFEFNSIYKALDFLMKGRPLSDFKFDISQYLLYTRGNIDNIVYQVTLLDETGNNIKFENIPLEIKIIYKYINREPIIEKICTEEEILWKVLIELDELYPRTYFYEVFNKLPVKRVA